MKNRIHLLLLCCLLVFANLSFANCGQLDGGIEVPVIEKNAVVLSIAIPDKYVDINGNLTLPVVATLRSLGNKKALVLVVTDSIQLPSNLSGAYTLNITLGDFHIAKELFFK